MKATPSRLIEQAKRLREAGDTTGSVIRLRLALGMIECTGAEESCRGAAESMLADMTGSASTFNARHNLGALISAARK